MNECWNQWLIGLASQPVPTDMQLDSQGAPFTRHAVLKQWTLNKLTLTSLAPSLDEEMDVKPLILLLYSI